MKPNYLQTYIITVAFVDMFHEAAKVLAARMQLAYQHSNIAGSFHWERLGRTTVLRFERSVPDDTEVIEGAGGRMTVPAAINQLRKELDRAQENLPACREDDDSTKQMEIDEAFNLLTPIIEALVEGEANVKVEGLPCQYPRLRVTMDVVFVDGATRLLGKDLMASKASDLAAYVRGNLVNVQWEELNQ